MLIQCRPYLQSKRRPTRRSREASSASTAIDLTLTLRIGIQMSNNNASSDRVDDKSDGENDINEVGKALRPRLSVEFLPVHHDLYLRTSP
jgi:hypothetical protein